MMKFEAIVMLGAVLASTAQAFWGKGHLLVARRAEQVLNSEASPEVIEKVIAELRVL